MRRCHSAWKWTTCGFGAHPNVLARSIGYAASSALTHVVALPIPRPPYRSASREDRARQRSSDPKCAARHDAGVTFTHQLAGHRLVQRQPIDKDTPSFRATFEQVYSARFSRLLVDREAAIDRRSGPAGRLTSLDRSIARPTPKVSLLSITLRVRRAEISCERQRICESRHFLQSDGLSIRSDLCVRDGRRNGRTAAGGEADHTEPSKHHCPCCRLGNS